MKLMPKINKKNFFFTTRIPRGIYELIVFSCKKNHDKKAKEKKDLVILKYNKIIKINYLLKYFIFLFKIIFYKDFIFKLKYLDVNFTNYFLGYIYRDYRCFRSRFFFPKRILMGLYRIFQIIEFCNSKKISEISAIYIDHGIYLNGVLFELLLRKRVKIYSNHLPRGIFVINSQNLRKKKYNDFLKFDKKFQIKVSDKKKIINC